MNILILDQNLEENFQSLYCDVSMHISSMPLTCLHQLLHFKVFITSFHFYQCITTFPSFLSVCHLHALPAEARRWHPTPLELVLTDGCQRPCGGWERKESMLSTIEPSLPQLRVSSSLTRAHVCSLSLLAWGIQFSLTCLCRTSLTSPTSAQLARALMLVMLSCGFNVHVHPSRQVTWFLS